MLIKQAPDIRSSEITPRDVYMRRREFIQAGAAALIGAGVAGSALSELEAQVARTKLPNVVKSPLSTTEPPNSYDHVTSYNNFYEFDGRVGDGPRNKAGSLKTRPWTIRVEGEVEQARTWPLDELISTLTLEERIYRFRCVETWSAIVPWVGIPLGDVIARLRPTAKAKFVQFTTLHDIGQFPMQRTSLLDWPYVEGLRMDEAVHPLTILAVGLYGEALPNQNGAPIRLVVPWKYGFKGIKSIVRIRFTERQPRTTWELEEPGAYGFYANVNPSVEHPRWSQARERRLGEFRMRPTLPFNGYADQVASLYSGMDLRRNN